VTPPPRLSVTPPPPLIDNGKLGQLRNAAKVQALKQKLLTGGGLPVNSQELVSQQNEIGSAQKTCSTKVKTIVKQMSTPVEIPEIEKMWSPPPSPVDKDLENVRKHVAISEKITHLHQSVGESKEKKHSSYKPSTLRRKVVSPFLHKKTGSEGTLSTSPFPETAKQMKKEAKEAEEEIGEWEKPLLQSLGSFEDIVSQTDAVACSDSDPVGGIRSGEEEGERPVWPVEISERTQNVEDSEEENVLPDAPTINEPSCLEGSSWYSYGERENHLLQEVEDRESNRGNKCADSMAVSATPAVVEGLSGINGIAEHLEIHSGGDIDRMVPSPVRTAEPLPSPSHSRDRSEGSDTIPLELVPSLGTVEATSQENSYTADPSLLKTSTESRSSSRSSTPFDYRSHDRRSREKSYDSNSLASSGSSYDRRRVATPTKEKEEEPVYTGPSYIVGGEKDDDHLVSIVLPFRASNSSSSKKKKEHQYSSGSLYTPSGSIYNSGRRRRKPEPTPPPLPPPRKPNNPVSVDEVFLSFKNQGEESQTTGGRKMHRAGSDGRPISSNIADVIVGVRENGLSSSSQLMAAEGENLSASYNFDRRSDGKASEYDHLPPLDQMGDHKSGRSLRSRTTSDVSSHRLKTRKKHGDFTASEVG